MVHIQFLNNCPYNVLCSILYFCLIPGQDPIHYHINLFVNVSLVSSKMEPLFSFAFLDFDIFEECRPVILLNVHHFKFVWCFLMISFRLRILVGIQQRQCCVLFKSIVPEGTWNVGLIQYWWCSLWSLC